MSTGARSRRSPALRKSIKQRRLRQLICGALTKRGTMSFGSGNPTVDRYIAEGYDGVRGMSSRFAATICGHVIRRQSALGIRGHFAEIGTFEGRFFIAMALGLQPDERALGIDLFEWPSPAVLDNFHANCARN